MNPSVAQFPKAPVAARAAEILPVEVDPGIALRDVLVMNYESLTLRLVRKLGCPDLASDCLHDAWLRLGEITVIAPVQSPQAYVYRVACNVAMDQLRGNRLWQIASDEDAELEALADPAPGPDAIAEKRSEVRALDRAMQRLPRRHRAVLVALRIDEMTRQEVAARYHLSLRSVDTALRQALDLCARTVDLPAMPGVRKPRRIPRQRRTEVQTRT